MKRLRTFFRARNRVEHDVVETAYTPKFTLFAGRCTELRPTGCGDKWFFRSLCIEQFLAIRTCHCDDALSDATKANLFDRLISRISWTATKVQEEADDSVKVSYRTPGLCIRKLYTQRSHIVVYSERYRRADRHLSARRQRNYVTTAG
jgi:hypothetical protein